MKNILLAVSLACIFVAGCNVSGRDMKLKKAPVVMPTNNPSFSQVVYNKYHAKVKSFMTENLLDKGFNGTILIAKEGTVVYESRHGFADLRKKDSITANTAFHIASTSKTFTAMATLQLVQEGKLRLEDTLSAFFPGFPYENVTVKNLLTHRSGIPNYLYFLEKTGWDMTKKITNREVLQVLYDAKPPKDAEPGKRFSYCNTNFVLLALLIEKITGTPYPVYMKEKIFDPLQMTHTFVCTPADSEKATPSFKANGRYWDQDFSDDTYGDKNIYTTAEDLLKWSLAVNNGKVINEQLLQLAYAPYSNDRPSVHNYGLGWRMLNLKNGKKVIYHNGRWHGSNSAFAYLPDEKVTIIIIGNKYSSNIYRSARKAYDLFGEYLQTDKNDDEEDTPLVKGLSSPDDVTPPITTAMALPGAAAMASIK